AAVRRVEGDARTIAEQRAPGSPRAGIDRQDGNGAILGPPGRQQGGQQRRLARARRPGHPDHVPVGLAAERGRGDLAEQPRGLLTVLGGGALQQVERGRRGAEVALAQACAEGGSVGAHAEPLAEEPSPLRPALTSSTMSRMMRVMSKSLGVYTAATPACSSKATSCSGMIPPTTTGAVTPSFRSASITAGISSRCEPDRIDRPITCTPSCRAEEAICVGVMRIPS